MQKITQNEQKRQPETQNFLYWYGYGFEGAMEQAARLERRAALQFLADEVATFAKCDPNFRASDRAGDPTFIMNFTLYLCGRYDERSEAIADKQRGNMAFYD